MKKEKKWTPHIIAVTALAVFIVLGLACATTPKGPPPTYLIGRKSAANEDGFLKGKKVVIFNIEMANRGKAAVAPSGGGGIFSAIANTARISRAIAFNNRARKFDEANEADLKEALKMMDGLIATTWQNAYDAETVQTAYDFGRTKNPSVNFFNKPKGALKKEIARICAENDAEFAVSIMQQIDHGYLEESYLGMGKMTAITYIAATICVFDQKGNVVLTANAKLPNVYANPALGYNLSPNDGDQYAELYLNGFANILAAILEFDTSAAFSIDELLEGILIQLMTTEDDEDDENENADE